jgi:hypothetical protein
MGGSKFFIKDLLTHKFSPSQANQWCTRGIELLASQKIEKCSVSIELAEKSLQEIQQFTNSASDFCLSTPRDFRNMFEDSTTVETKALVSQVGNQLCNIISVKNPEYKAGRSY